MTELEINRHSKSGQNKGIFSPNAGFPSIRCWNWRGIRDEQGDGTTEAGKVSARLDSVSGVLGIFAQVECFEKAGGVHP